jgi:hypothetical protein
MIAIEIEVADIELEGREAGGGEFVYALVRFGRLGCGMPGWRSSGRDCCRLGWGT